MPYFDLTVSAVKSVSVLHASYRVAAMQARTEHRPDRAQALDAMADAIEQAMMDGARDAVRWLEEHATYTRTGHHSASTGEWRDGDLVAGRQHLPARPDVLHEQRFEHLRVHLPGQAQPGRGAAGPLARGGSPPLV